MPGIKKGAQRRAISRAGDDITITTKTTERIENDGDFDDKDDSSNSWVVKAIMSQPSVSNRQRSQISDGPSFDMQATIRDDTDAKVSDGDVTGYYGEGGYGVGEYPDGSVEGTQPSIVTYWDRRYRVVAFHPSHDGTVTLDLTKV